MASRPKQPEPRPAPRLYLVTPPVADAAGFGAELTTALDAADIAAVLLRLAETDERTLINRVKALAPLAQDKGAALLLDGHAELVARSGADGSHLSGIEAFTAAREILKPDWIAGIGGVTSRHDAMLAADMSADYVMFGSWGATHPADRALTEERTGWWAEVFELPCIAFTASLEDIAPLVKAGADFIALDCVWGDPRGAAAALAEAAKSLALESAA